MNELHVIAHIHTPFRQKFGIPRQSGMVDMPARIVFCPKYREREAVRGLEEYSHIWVIWGFSQAEREEWSATVRPPRLGGNKRMGVFATRSPYRPNPIGLSSLRLERIEYTEQGPVLHVLGADILDGTPIYDIKPYLPFTDCHTDAVGGFADEHINDRVQVLDPKGALEMLDEPLRSRVTELLAYDPHPSYRHDGERIYGMDVDGYSVRFTVEDGALTVESVAKLY